MAAVIFEDRIDTLEADEEDGAIVRMVRRCRVIKLTDDDYKVLFSALNNAGVPAPGSGVTGSGAGNLILRKRSVAIVDGDPATMDVTLTYEHGFSEGQSLTAPPFGVIAVEVRSALNQVQTNQDLAGDLVSLTYTYPSDYKLNPDLADQEVTQGWLGQVLSPQKVLSIKGKKTTPTPDLVALALEGKVNKNAFFGRAAGAWLCMGVRYRPLNVPAREWYFEIECQTTLDGGSWNPRVVFQDPNDGDKPVPDPVEGLGIKTVTIYDEVNFEGVIGARIMGG